MVREAYGSLLMVMMIDLTVNTPPHLDAMLDAWKARYTAVPLYQNTNLTVDPVRD